MRQTVHEALGDEAVAELEGHLEILSNHMVVNAASLPSPASELFAVTYIDHGQHAPQVCAHPLCVVSLPARMLMLMDVSHARARSPAQELHEGSLQRRHSFQLLALPSVVAQLASAQAEAGVQSTPSVQTLLDLHVDSSSAGRGVAGLAGTPFLHSELWFVRCCLPT